MRKRARQFDDVQISDRRDVDVIELVLERCLPFEGRSRRDLRGRGVTGSVAA